MVDLNTVRTPCGLYTFYPLFEVHLCTVTFGFMYGLFSTAVSNQGRVIVALVRYPIHNRSYANVEPWPCTTVGQKRPWKEGGGHFSY